MGQISNTRVIIIVICFALTSVFIYWQPSSSAINREIPLRETLADIKGWQRASNQVMEQDIVTALEIDEYVFQNYSNGSGHISLYIGYYKTSKKIGAAHSPLVCFPGQGWVLSDVKGKSITVGHEKINCSSMIISKGQRKEFVIYWFQAFNKTTPGTFFQKIYTLWGKFRYHREDNAFVRVSIPMAGQTKQAAFNTGVRFIESFYPVFLGYVTDGKLDE